MSRHRNIRSMNYSEECDGYDDVYGHSVEDDYCISPSDAAQFMYNREGRNRSMGAFFNTEGTIAEGDENETPRKENIEDDIDKVKLESCVESIKKIVGESVSHKVLVDTIINYNFNTEKALDSLLTHMTDKNLSTKTSKDLNTVIDKNFSSSLTSLIKQHKELKMKTPSKFGLGKKINFKKKVIDVTDSIDAETNPINTSNTSPNICLDNFKSNSGIHTDSHDSLSELVRSHLQKNANESSSLVNLPTKNDRNFTQKLSNLSLYSSSPESSCTKLNEKLDSLQKLVEQHSLKPRSISRVTSDPIENEKWTIDLTLALKQSDISLPNIVVQKEDVKIVEHFIPQFVDCETTPEFDINKAIEPLKDCYLDIKQVYEGVELDVKQCSHFGKIICKSYIRTSPYNLPPKKNYNTVQWFQFNVPSPDDKIKAVFQNIRK